MHPNVTTIFQSINQAKNILIISHAKPDGDTLGSALAFAHYCDNIGKKYSLLCADVPAEFFSHLPKIKEYTQWVPTFTMYDLIIVVDHGSAKQSGFEAQLESMRTSEKTKIINIDHHISNTNFGHLNYVEPQYSSTCEVVYLMMLNQNINVTKDMATCLMTGLVTDTGHFMNSSTKASSLEVAGDLVRHGARLPEIASQVMSNKSVAALNLWGDVFNRLTINPKYKLAYTVILQDDLLKPGVDKEAIDGLVNFLTGLKDADLVMLLTQEDSKTIKGSFRTQRDDIDCSLLASVWGGGGHKKAAGFKLDGKLIQKEGLWTVV